MGGLDDALPPTGGAERGADGSAPSAPPPAVPLEELLQLPATAPLGGSRDVLWNAVLPEQVALLHAKGMQLYTLHHGVTASTATDGLRMEPPAADGCFSAGRWDPHHAHSLGLAAEKDILTVDTRTMKPCAAARRRARRAARCSSRSSRPLPPPAQV
eukprot:4420769-Prymnesium_polylepis.1